MIQQSAAIPYRWDEHGRLSVLLITSRTRKRWIVPKGKVTGMHPSRSAEREAFEEAGVLGRIDREPFGQYHQGEDHPSLPSTHMIVQAYAMEVIDELPAWQEMDQRERRWFPIRKAIAAVSDGEIKAILRKFEKHVARRHPHSKKASQP